MVFNRGHETNMSGEIMAECPTHQSPSAELRLVGLRLPPGGALPDPVLTLPSFPPAHEQNRGLNGHTPAAADEDMDPNDDTKR